MSHLSQRHVARRGLFGKKVILQVAPSDSWLGRGKNAGIASWDIMAWRDATDQDLYLLKCQARYEEKRRFSDIRFRVGQRVHAVRSGFHKGAKGIVEFQEPNGGRVWVSRDGAGGPCYFYADELDAIPATAKTRWLD